MLFKKQKVKQGDCYRCGKKLNFPEINWVCGKCAKKQIRKNKVK